MKIKVTFQLTAARGLIGEKDSVQSPASHTVISVHPEIGSLKEREIKINFRYWRALALSPEMAQAAQCAEQGESLWTYRFPSCRGEARSSELQLVIEVKAVHCPLQGFYTPSSRDQGASPHPADTTPVLLSPPVSFSSDMELEFSCDRL